MNAENNKRENKAAGLATVLYFPECFVAGYSITRGVLWQGLL